MRRVRYSVASSLDGFIAGPDGEHEWIVMDPAIDFGALMASFDTVLIGRRTFEAMQRMYGGAGGMPGMQAIVFSRTLKPSDHPRVTIRDDAVAAVKELKTLPGKDIWLFGGGDLCRGLLEAGLVDAVEVGLMPVLLGAGVPLLSGPFQQFDLKLASSETLPSGTLMLKYEPLGERRAQHKSRSRSKRSR